MSTKDDNLSLIISYLDGEMDTTAMLAFEERLAVEPSLMDQFNEIKALKSGIEEYGKDEVKSKIRRWEREAQSKASGSMFVWGQGMKWAAGFALIVVGAGLYLLLTNKQTDEASPFQQAFRPYPNIVDVRGERSPTLLDSLMLLYDNAKYEQLITLNRPASAEQLTDDDALIEFYLSQSYMATGKYELALEKLALFNDAEHPFYEAARFHSALALAQIGQIDSAHALLTVISIEKGAFRAEAERVLMQVDGKSEKPENRPEP